MTLRSGGPGNAGFFAEAGGIEEAGGTDARTAVAGAFRDEWGQVVATLTSDGEGNGETHMTVSVDEAKVRDEIAKERRELAAILDELPGEDWERPSLCAGWRVREVAAHMTMPFRFSVARFGLEMVRARGDFNRMADRCARKGARSPVGELAATLRENAEHAWKPPGGGFAGALSHDVIHGMDMTVALGIDRRVPEERLRIVLQNMDPRSVRFFGTDLDGVRLCADDIDWSYGSGTPVSGLAQDLLLVVCGRRLPAERLRGAPAARFTEG